MLELAGVAGPVVYSSDTSSARLALAISVISLACFNLEEVLINATELVAGEAVAAVVISAFSIEDAPSDPVAFSFPLVVSLEFMMMKEDFVCELRYITRNISRNYDS